MRWLIDQRPDQKQIRIRNESLLLPRLVSMSIDDCSNWICWLSEINQSDWGMSFKIYMAKISLIDGPTSVTNSLKIRIRDKFVLLLHKVRLSVNIWYTHHERSLYPQTWFIPLIHSINGFYTFDINIYRYIRRGNNDKDLIMIRISSRSLTVNV